MLNALLPLEVRRKKTKRIEETKNPAPLISTLSVFYTRQFPRGKVPCPTVVKTLVAQQYFGRE